MSRSSRARWRLGLGIAGMAVLAAVLFALDGLYWAVALVVVLSALLVRAIAPRREADGISHWAAQERHVRDGVPIVYVRPISLDCLLLRLSLGRRAQRAVWVDIWADDEAAAFVRDINGGTEVVPTIIMRNGDAVAHPDPGVVARELAA